jgi:hypothetical protein
MSGARQSFNFWLRTLTSRGSVRLALGASREIDTSDATENQLLTRGFSKELLDSCRGRSNAACYPPESSPCYLLQ